MAKRIGPPEQNKNAVTHGLYSAQPKRYVQVAADVMPAEMASFAANLGDGALWISEELAQAYAHAPVAGAHKLIGLYASVAQEMHQLGAELAGESGIKPAPLGKLSDDAYEIMMRKEAKALDLILNQSIHAFQHIQAKEVLLSNGLFVEGEFGLELSPVLYYLASSMRAAKRIMRDMAANRAWKQRDVEQEDDLTARFLKAIGGDE